MDNRDDEGGGVSGLVNKALDAVGGGSSGGGAGSDSELARQARGDDADATRGETDVNMFTSSGDDTVPDAMGERAEGSTDPMRGARGGQDPTKGAGGGSDPTRGTGGGSDPTRGAGGAFDATRTQTGSESLGTQSDYGSGVDRGGEVAGTGYGADTASYVVEETTAYSSEPGYSETDVPGPGDEPGFGTTAYEEGTGSTGFSREPGFGAPADADLSPGSGFTVGETGENAGRE